MSDMTLWGFDGSTYVRTVKMVLAEKGVTDFKQVPLNVLAGDPKTPERRERHPFGKVAVLDHDGMRILETTAIARYLNDVLPGKSLIPSAPKDRARMDMAPSASAPRTSQPPRHPTVPSKGGTAKEKL
jgi:glutathione S-transferase